MKNSKFLMCAPKYFTVNYEINPWMNKKNGINAEKSNEQWQRLISLYLKNNCEIKTIEPQKGLPDLVFTANGAFVINNKVVIANFKFKERRRESILFKKWFENNGYDITTLPDDIIFEGQGDAFHLRGKIYAGYGFRSIKKSHTYLKKIFKCDIISLRLINPKFYHLDTCFCILSNGEVIYYPRAFDKQSRINIKKNFKVAIPINHNDALQFFCNSVSIENVLITSAKNYSSGSVNKVRKLGYNVKSVDLSEFKKSGGGARCLTLSI